MTDPTRRLAASFVREARFLDSTTGPYGLSKLTEDDWLALLAQSDLQRVLAAARAEAFAEIRDRVRRMPTVKVPRADFEWSGETVRAVDIAAVLALLPSVPPDETT